MLSVWACTRGAWRSCVRAHTCVRPHAGTQMGWGNCCGQGTRVHPPHPAPRSVRCYGRKKSLQGGCECCSLREQSLLRAAPLILHSRDKTLQALASQAPAFLWLLSE